MIIHIGCAQIRVHTHTFVQIRIYGNVTHATTTSAIYVKRPITHWRANAHKHIEKLNHIIVY